MKRTILYLIVGTAIASATAAEEPSNTVPALTADAIKAYRAKDYTRFLDLEKRALQLDPSSPRLQYNVACGLALQGNANEAVQLLDRLLARKLDMGAETDEDFAGIRSTREWHEFESKLADLRKPIVHSEIAFTLEDPTLMSVGIAVDPSNGDTYIASIRERKIVRRTKAGAVSDFIQKAQDGFLSGASLLIDAPRHLLYASTSAVPFMEGFRKEDDGKSGVFAFDLKSGKLVRKAMLPGNGKPHFLNALALDRGGNVYVSDSLASGIYRLAPGKSELEPFIAPTVFHATQGLAFSDDEKTLFVADFSNGLWALDMASKTPRQIEAPPDVWLGGMDGLSRTPDGFIAVQITVKPERVLRLRLDRQWRRVATVEVLEMNHPDYSGPIQGVVASGAFFYIANSQIDLGNGETGAYAAEKARPTVVLRLPLDKVVR